MNFNYKKVIVLGNNGSGKSYFSKKLAEITAKNNGLWSAEAEKYLLENK